MKNHPLTVILCLVAIALLGGCSEPTAPPAVDDGLGDLDPGSGTVVLKRLIAETPEGVAVPIVLEAGPVELLDDGATVVMGVRLRNAGDVEVAAPLIVWIGDFDPDHVTLLDADFVTPVLPGIPGELPWYGLDYSGLLGGDDSLAPDEISDERVWSFRDIGYAPFSFGGWIESGQGPAPAELGGLCFSDDDLDGEHDVGEQPLPDLRLDVRAPDGRVLEVISGPQGRWSVPVTGAGLYEVRVILPPILATRDGDDDDGNDDECDDDPIFGPWGPIVTTPNPMYVAVTPGPDGAPQSYGDADVGVWGLFFPPPAEPVVFTDAPVDSLHMVPWELIGAGLIDGRILELSVGFSGCSPPHEFTLFAHDGFLESLPPQLNMVLRHETEEACDAWFEESLFFDLWPVFLKFSESNPPGELILNLFDFHGDVTSISVSVPPVDGELP